MKKKDKVKILEYIYTTLSYEMKMVIAKKFDVEIKLQKVTISLYIDKKSPCSSHNHIFNYIDSIQLNSTVQSVAGQEVAKDYTPATVYRNLQRFKWADHHNLLKDVRDTYLDLKVIHNTDRDFKKANSDI